MDTRVAVISIIVEQEDAIEELNTRHDSTLSAGWAFRIDRRGSALSVLPLMHRRMSSVHFPEKLGV